MFTYTCMNICMLINICLYAYVCTFLCMHAVLHINTGTPASHLKHLIIYISLLRIHTLMYIRMYIRTYIRTYIYTCQCGAHSNIPRSSYIYIHTYIYMCTHTYIHTHTHTYIYMHTYIHTYRSIRG